MNENNKNEIFLQLLVWLLHALWRPWKIGTEL